MLSTFYMFQTALTVTGFFMDCFGNNFDLDKLKPFADEVEHVKMPPFYWGEWSKWISIKRKS